MRLFTGIENIISALPFSSKTKKIEEKTVVHSEALPLENAALENKKNLEKLKTTFQESVAQYHALLIQSPPLKMKECKEQLKKALTEFSLDTPSNQAKFPTTNETLQEATKFFALVAVAEQWRKEGAHTPSWEQTLASLTLVAQSEQAIDRIQMGTGEGKTFTLASAAIYEALHDRVTTIHTDKIANVYEARNKMHGLYDLFGLSVRYYHTKGDPFGERFLGSEHLAGEQLLQQEPVPRVMYGVSGDIIGDYIQQRSLAITFEQELQRILRFSKEEQESYFKARDPGFAAILRLEVSHRMSQAEKDRQKQARAEELLAALQKNIARLKNPHQHNSTTFIDEGDQSLSELSEVILVGARESDPETTEDQEAEPGFSRSQRNKFELAWNAIGVPPTAELLQSVGSILYQEDPQALQLQKAEQEIGLRIIEPTASSLADQDEDPHTILYTKASTHWNNEQLYLTSLFSLLMQPGTFRTLLDELPTQESEVLGENFTLTQEHKEKIFSLLETSAKKPTLGGDFWDSMIECIPPLSKELVVTLMLENAASFPTLNLEKNSRVGIRQPLRQLQEQAPELYTILLLNESPTLTAEEWMTLENTLPGFKAKISLLLFSHLADHYWQDIFAAECQTVMNVRYQMKHALGNEFVIRFVTKRYDPALRRDVEVEEFLVDENETEKIARIKTLPPEQKKIYVLGAGMQQEEKKEFEDDVQAYITLRYAELELPFPEPSMKLDSIYPANWYELQAAAGKKVKAISGSMENPDSVIQSEGVGKKYELDPRILPTEELKRRAVIEFVRSQSDRPVLLCTEDMDEVLSYKEALSAKNELDQPAQKILVISAENSNDEAYISRAIAQAGPGQVIILQITARGLDFGRMGALAERTHSFEDAVIVISGYLSEPRLEKQVIGRVGGKRPSGGFLYMFSREDKMLQKYLQLHYDEANSTEKKWEALHERYIDTTQVVASLSSLDIRVSGVSEPPTHDANWSWPATLSELVSELQLLQDLHEQGKAAKYFEEKAQTESIPLWYAVFAEDIGLPRNLNPAPQLKRFRRSRFSLLLRVHSELSTRQLDQLVHQQQLNAQELQQHREDLIAKDKVLQLFRQFLLEPRSSEPLSEHDKKEDLLVKIGKLPSKLRQQMWSELLENADIFYRQSLSEVKDLSGSDRLIRERKMQHFTKYLTEILYQWADENQVSSQISS